MNSITDSLTDDICATITNPVQQPPPVHNSDDDFADIFGEIIDNLGRYSPVEGPATIEDIQGCLVMATAKLK